MRAWRSEAEMRKALEGAKGTLRLEGMELTAEEEALLLREARGEIDEAEFVRLVLALAKRSTPSSKG